MPQNAQDIINDSYQSWFNRAPEQAGLDHWTEVASGMGGDLSQLDDMILASAQGDDRGGVVNAAYNDLFGHNADEQGLNHWQNDFWDQHWGGGNVTQDDIWTTIGAQAGGDDEQHLYDRLVSGDPNPSLAPFRDTARADTFWQSLNDEGGAFTGAAGVPATQQHQASDTNDLLEAFRQAFDNQQPQQPAQPNGEQGGQSGQFLEMLRHSLESNQNAPQIANPSPTTGGGYRAYMDPYLDDVFSSSAREVNDTYSRRMGDLAGAANMAGAWGDDTHSDGYRSLAEDEAQTIGDLRSRISAQGYEDAMARWNADINRGIGVDSTNAQLDQSQQGLTQQGIGLGINADNSSRSLDLQGRSLDHNIDLSNRNFDLESLLAMDQNQINWLNTLMGVDNYERTWDQAAEDREYQNFWNEQMWPLYMTNLGVGWASGIPSNSVSINTTSTPNNSAWSNVGGLF